MILGYSVDLGRPPVYPLRKESLKPDQQKYKEVQIDNLITI